MQKQYKARIFITYNTLKRQSINLPSQKPYPKQQKNGARQSTSKRKKIFSLDKNQKLKNPQANSQYNKVNNKIIQYKNVNPDKQFGQVINKVKTQQAETNYEINHQYKLQQSNIKINKQQLNQQMRQNYHFKLKKLKKDEKKEENNEKPPFFRQLSKKRIFSQANLQKFRRNKLQSLNIQEQIKSKDNFIDKKPKSSTHRRIFSSEQNTTRQLIRTFNVNQNPTTIVETSLNKSLITQMNQFIKS